MSRKITVLIVFINIWLSNICYSQEFQNLKNVPTSYQTEIYKAFSYYPELKSVEIEFRLQPIMTTMACKPKYNFLLKRRANRKYIIFINNNNSKRSSVYIDELPCNSIVGVVGHEFGHVVDYTKKSDFQIIKLGFNYLFKSKRKAVERSIDSLAIAHGLGVDLYEFSNYVLNQSNAPESYKDYKRRTYMTPQEILRMINNSH